MRQEASGRTFSDLEYVTVPFLSSSVRFDHLPFLTSSWTCPVFGTGGWIRAWRESRSQSYAPPEECKITHMGGQDGPHCCSSKEERVRLLIPRLEDVADELVLADRSFCGARGTRQ